MNLSPPPPSQNSHAVRWHCTAESERRVAEMKSWFLCRRPTDQQDCDRVSKGKRDRNRMHRASGSCRKSHGEVSVRRVVDGIQACLLEPREAGRAGSGRRALAGRELDVDDRGPYCALPRHRHRRRRQRSRRRLNASSLCTVWERRRRTSARSQVPRRRRNTLQVHTHCPGSRPSTRSVNARSVDWKPANTGTQSVSLHYSRLHACPKWHPCTRTVITDALSRLSVLTARRHDPSTRVL